MLHRKADFLPNTPKAQKLAKFIRDQIGSSERYIMQQSPIWDSAELNYRAYRNEDEEDRESREKYGVQKIIIPTQFATAQIILTFLMEIFTALNPVLKVRGADPASVRPSKVMELCIDYDYRNNRGYMMLYQWFFNSLRYSYGIMHNQWGRKLALRRQLIQEPGSEIEWNGQTFRVPGNMSYKRDWYPTFEGNMWNIVDNRMWFPDPRVPIARFQDGQFCAHRDYIHDHDLRKMDEDGYFFNTSEIKDMPASSINILNGDTHNRDNFRSTIALNAVLAQAKKDKMHLNEHFVCTIIPKDFDLSTEDRPQEWLFNLIDDHYIVRGEESPYTPKFPYAVVEPYPDILAFMSMSLMELTQPLHDHMNFLFNSHMANVRRIVKDTLLVDPSKVNVQDLLENMDGGVIRLLQRAWGTDPAMAVKQLPIGDVTSGFFAALEQITHLGERVTGASAQMFGQISSGRRTAFELQGVFRQAGARMKMMADLMSCEGVAPLTEMMAGLRQENMTMDQYVQLAGYTAQDLGVASEEVRNKFLKVRPDMVSGVFAFPAEQGVLPYDRASSSEVLTELFDRVSQQPFLMQAFNPVLIFKELIRQKGLHNMDDFMNNGIKADAQIMNPDQLGELYASKQIKPLGSGMPDQGVKDEEGTLSMMGALNGAGAAYNNGTQG